MVISGADVPAWSSQWRLFATARDLPFAIAGLVLIVLLALWWQQQSKAWVRVVLACLLAALLLSIASYYVFVVPPHFAGCPEGCAGWRGYPMRYALFRLDGRSVLAPLDFALNSLVLLMIVLTAAAVWRLLGIVFDIGARARRTQALFVLVFVLAPWAFLPRFLSPSQPAIEGEELRLANNAVRAAEFTYGITGPWIHRLAIEDIRRDLAAEMIVALQPAPTPEPTAAAPATTPEPSTGSTPVATLAPAPPSSAATQAELRPAHLVCLRGYTWFFVPWARYRIALGADGATALSLTRLPLTDSCWQPPPAPADR